MIGQAQLEAAAEWAYSSVVEHCVDIAGVASSILATPTIFPFAMSLFIIYHSSTGAIAAACGIDVPSLSPWHELSIASRPFYERRNASQNLHSAKLASRTHILWRSELRPGLSGGKVGSR